MPIKDSLPKLLSELRSSFSQVKSVTKPLAILTAAAAMCSPLIAQSYKVTNLISDGFVTAAVTDPGFLNPWAMSTSGTWWISTANTGSNYVVKESFHDIFDLSCRVR